MSSTQRKCALGKLHKISRLYCACLVKLEGVGEYLVNTWFVLVRVSGWFNHFDSYIPIYTMLSILHIGPADPPST